MNDNSKDGKTNQTRRKERAYQPNDNSQISTENEGDSGSSEHQSGRITRDVDSSLGRTTIYRVAGGILGLLRQIVSKGLCYMDDHGERLETRLMESKKAKAEFLETAAALEKELVRLLEQAEKLPEDPNEQE
ncbi:hypothetical protein [Okeania sp. SIO2B3]|uniref:hypothetical protein n=1 Tax=Okeania sp. SIO2B3 TaxID=2607784 RepID=UPI0013C0F781|nr:hypothetical protein [Okeania sp. SIO2B3]NET46745.1 hypothetical protein [Okeania sp. SIO2B3]